MKALIYVRGKDAIQQIGECEEYAAANGLEVISVAKNESEFTAFVLSGKIDCVLVLHASRITRSKKEYEKTEDMLRSFGVEIIAAGGELL